MTSEQYGDAMEREGPPIDTDRPEYNLLAAIDGINRPVADLYTGWAWHRSGSAQATESMHSKLNAIEARTQKAREALEVIESDRSVDTGTERGETA